MDSILKLILGTTPEAANSLLILGIIVLLFGSFVRIFTALNILRFGLGLKDGGFGIVIVLLALVMSAFVLERNLGNENFAQLLKLDSAGLDNVLKPHLEKNVDSAIFERLNKAASNAEGNAAMAQPKNNFSLLLCSFLVSELRIAFKLGLLFILPFFVVDLLITNIMMGLGITQLSQQVVALPLKILLFVVIDGWSLVAVKLLGI